MVAFDARQLSAPLTSLVEQIRTSSVLAPLLVVDVIVGTIVLLASLMIAGPLLNLLWGLFGFCILFTATDVGAV